MKFIFITDTHYGGPDNQGYRQQPRYNCHAEELLDRLSDFIRQEGVSFVVHGGDLADWGNRDNMRLARQLMKRLPCRVYLSLGNHDMTEDDSVAAWLEETPQLFPDGSIDTYRTYLGGDEEMEKYFGKPLYKLRQEWRQLFEDQSLIQSEQGQIADRIPEVTPYDVQQFLDTVSVEDLPVVPIKYQLSQICIYPDREAAALAVKERLLSLRERVINGEKFATLARIYSEDPGSARKGGELGLASKSIFWPAFSDAAMALRPGQEMMGVI